MTGFSWGPRSCLGYWAGHRHHVGARERRVFGCMEKGCLIILGDFIMLDVSYCSSSVFNGDDIVNPSDTNRFLPILSPYTPIPTLPSFNRNHLAE
jgi:hypothetical protein